jgi:hypothetical protein
MREAREKKVPSILLDFDFDIFLFGFGDDTRKEKKTQNSTRTAIYNIIYLYIGGVGLGSPMDGRSGWVDPFRHRTTFLFLGFSFFFLFFSFLQLLHSTTSKSESIQVKSVKSEKKNQILCRAHWRGDRAPSCELSDAESRELSTVHRASYELSVVWI